MSGISRLSGQSGVDASQFDAGTDASQAASGASQTATARWPGAGALPGEKATRSGQYVLVDSRGNQVGKEKTITKGEPFPPARPGLSYKLVDATKQSSETGTGGAQVLRPGDKAKVSGQYELVDRNGNGMDRAATVVKGEPLPPTPGDGQSWKLVDMTGTKRSGEKVEISGQYALVDSNGKLVKGKETTAVKGERLPATPKSGQAWKLVDVTKHVEGEKLKGDVKPGQKAPTSGQYELINADGTRTGKEVTAVKGEPLPPARKAGQMYKLVDKT
jgi:hypothetical protein